MDRQSKYCYPGTDVYINKQDIRDAKVLEKFENTMTSLRLSELHYKPIYGKFDLSHLQKIHKHIFGDVYPFAGKLRDENIGKSTFVFAQVRFLKDAANDLFKQLKNENYLLNQPVDQFSERAAHYMAEMNVCHPFREGNGRTQREFIRTLALQAGYFLDWSKQSKELIMQASIRSVVDSKDLAKVIRGSMINEEPSKEVSKIFLDQRNKGYER